jgi:hypothetical protein
VVALSTAEAEYIAASKAAQEAIYLRRMLMDLGECEVEATAMYEDNESCIDLADHPSASDRTKHIDIRVFYLRQAKADGHVRLVPCHTGMMTADMLTKSLSGLCLKFHREDACGMTEQDYFPARITYPGNGKEKRNLEVRGVGG